MARFEGTLFFIDGFNRKTTRSYGIEAADFATAQATLITLANATVDLIQSGIVKTRVHQDQDFATVVSPGANNDAGLTMIWELSPLGSEKLAATKLPAPQLGIFDANGNLILTDLDVLTYRSILISGDILISDGEVAADLKKGSLDK